ncbi:hypothetical protein A0J61_09131 [Choanephora cucurbitarum]|uniref:Uncharacterized protein n=1 Tax=Choanephora cucurbitarum TaxID=101091 RepID=A0A1C7N149_9FUNG|nr:hypothetical protein A0J61_09131 [Choanephora cucurbitarum]
MSQDTANEISILIDEYFAKTKNPNLVHFKNTNSQHMEAMSDSEQRKIIVLFKSKEAEHVKKDFVNSPDSSSNNNNNSSSNNDDDDASPSSSLSPLNHDLNIQVSSLATTVTASETPLGVKVSRHDFDLNAWEVDNTCTDDAFTNKIRCYIDNSFKELTQRAGYCNFEEDLLKLLSLSSIILFKAVYHDEASLVSAIGKEAIKKYYDASKAKVYEDLEDFDLETLVPISRQLMEFRNNGSRIKLDAELTALQLKTSKSMQNTIQVLKSLAIQVKKPMKTELKESQLTASFVETFFSALFEYDDCLPYNANVREDNACKESYCPDYKIEFYEDDEKKFCNFYGEIKPKKSIKACKQKIYKDLYKLAIFAREEMKQTKLKAVMIAHIVHNCFNFYLMADKKDFF